MFKTRSLRYVILAMVGIALVIAGFVFKSILEPDGLIEVGITVVVVIIGMVMVIFSWVFGWRGPVAPSAVGDREDT